MTFVADVGALVAEPVVQACSGPRFGLSDVGRLRAGLDRPYRMDHTVGSLPANREACRVEREITRVIATASYTVRIGRELQTTLAELHGHRAWYGYDGGRVEQGRLACLEALAAAHLVEDALLQVSVLETLVLLAIKADRSWEAASAVEHASRLAGRTGAGHTVHLVLALREANVATHAGDLAGARRALSRAVNRQSRTDEDAEVPNWARFVGPFEVDYATADLCVRAGQPKRAVPFLRAATRGTDGELARNGASYRVRLASVLLETGEVDEACAELSAALDVIDGISSPRLLGRLREFQLAIGRVDCAVARECGERIGRIFPRSAA
ncbi:hypothetical protein [Streptomyces hainanensis]|uniref:Transcriptional regulator n=1 Tax=Streptomyces hainanensis TaxID=402648 RepID=A0A4R4TY06_9ACTN|nr:hypothetical protein [Streptomyces hainanensis]TDC79079.1 hypothetical protein E1283_03495 [Streptomyces hainanensis]